jgi:replicative DNA helicase
VTDDTRALPSDALAEQYLPALLAAAEAEVDAVASGAVQDSTAVRVGDVLDDYLEVLETGEEPPGIAFHTADLRRDLRPLRKGSLAVIAAWSGIGKSIASWNYAAHAAIHEKQTVLFHALEMSRDEMLDRLIAAEAKVDYGHITSRKMTGWDWEKISVARGRIEDADLHIDDTEGVSLAMLRASVRRVKPDLLVVDQIPIMTPPDPRAPREQQVAAIAYGLKNLARAEDIAVLAVAQLNDDAMKRSDKRPTQHDLRESKAIVHASDTVVVLHDEAHLEPESPRAGEIDWIVVKQRGGRKLTITLANQLAFQRHVDMAA